MQQNGFTIVFRKRPVRDPLGEAGRRSGDALVRQLEAEKVFPDRGPLSESERGDPRGELYVAKIGDFATVGSVLQQLKKDPSIGLAYVAPPRYALAKRVQKVAGANASGLPLSWQSQIRLDQTMALPQWQGGQTIHVAMIDTGIDSAHPQLSDITFYDHSKRPNPAARPDPLGHGSHVTGLVGAALDPGNNFSGIALNCVSLEAHRGIFPIHDVGAYYRALAAARASGARLINLSLGGEVEDATESEEIAGMLNEGCIVVAAIGNSAEITNKALYPAACKGVIAVGSVDRQGVRASTSSTGKHILLAAPGVDIESTVPTYRCKHVKPRGMPPLGLMSGTSMAAPIVTAVIARMLSFKPGLDRLQVIDLIKTRHPGPWNREIGHGVLDAHALLSAL